MDPQKTPNRMLARSREPTAQTRHHEAPAGIVDANAATVLEEIRAHLENYRFRDAQRLAKEAASSFPEVPAVQKMNRALNDRRAKRRPSTGRDSTQDFLWLKDPPPEARGKWVALAGSEVLALGTKLTDLVESLSTEDLSKKPLLVRVD